LCFEMYDVLKPATGSMDFIDCEINKTGRMSPLP